jgi:hypothetical protein
MATALAAATVRTQGENARRTLSVTISFETLDCLEN